MQIGIRTDASPRIGTGHLMRCLTLADALREQGAPAFFIMRNHEPSLITQVQKRGYEVHLLPSADTNPLFEAESPYADWLGTSQRQDADQTKAILSTLETKLDWLIVDHYALDAQWETQMRPYAQHLLVIDDLANRPHDCDLLLDQNLHDEMVNRYAGLIPSSATAMVGPQFALLRSEFIAARKKLRKRDGAVQRVLVFFGGADLADMTGKTIEAISDWPFSVIQFDIVIGSANPHAEELRRQTARYSNMRLHADVMQMSELMVAADLAIGAAGTTTWERCCLGLPTLLVVLADNQRDIANTLHQTGAAVSLGDANSVTSAALSQALTALTADTDAIHRMSERCFTLVDGSGTERVVTQMLSRTRAKSAAGVD